MKLTSVEIHPANSSDVAVLSFRDPRSLNPFNVKNIVGLDPDVIIPRYYATAGSSKFYNLVMDKRDITMKIGLNPNFASFESYSDLRDTLYKMISSSRTGLVQIQFKNLTEVVAVLSGFVSKFDTAHFDKTQEIDITISCDDPMLKAPVPTNVSVAGLNPSNTVIADDKSTAPHGFSFVMNISGAFASFTLFDPYDNSWGFQVAPAGGFLNGDVLHFSSEVNNKQLYLIRGANTIYLADKIALGSIWPILFPGSNSFAFVPATYLAWSSISHYPTYWGV